MKLSIYSKIVLLLTFFLLTACQPKQEEPKKLKEAWLEEPKKEEFKPPMQPYGLPYRVGSLGGKFVNLGEGVRADYEVCPVWTWDKVDPMCKVKPKPKRTYDSVLTNLYFEMSYTDGILLNTYYKNPQAESLRKQYDAQKNLVDSPWVSVTANAASRYLKDGDMNAWLKRILDRSPSMGWHTYIYADGSIYGLEKYVPHPKWIYQFGYEDTDDLYVYKDDQNIGTTTIICSNSARMSWCTQRFIMQPEIKVFIELDFRRNQLKDWKLIQEQAKKMILSFVVTPNNQLK